MAERVADFLHLGDQAVPFVFAGGFEFFELAFGQPGLVPQLGDFFVVFCARVLLGLCRPGLQFVHLGIQLVELKFHFSDVLVSL